MTVVNGADGSPAVVFVDPKTQTIVEADFR